ncbi:MAG: hypothetical protein ACPGUV_04530 [Polyangiales bacterium]
MEERATGLTHSDMPAADAARCDASLPGREVSEYDTSGDSVPDVRKVFRRVGDKDSSKVLMVCRETDVNGDGRKDVVRYYTDDGQLLREEVDQNLDGRINQVLFFERGRVVRKELDSNGDGKVDTRVFYDKGKPSRRESDPDGRSSAGKWQPSRWEYFQKGRVVRVGTDLDGDGRVDRWDRNEALIRAQRDEEDEGVVQDQDGS